MKYGKRKTYKLTRNLLSTTVSQGGCLRRLIYFRISLKTLIFAILKMSLNKNCVYRNLHHQRFERQYVVQFVRYFGIPWFLTVSFPLIYCVQTVELSWACRSFRFSRKAKAQFWAYKHLIPRSNALFARPDWILPMGLLLEKWFSSGYDFLCFMIIAPSVLKVAETHIIIKVVHSSLIMSRES